MIATAGQDLLSALRAADVPVGSSCAGDGICGKCGLRVLSGVVSPPTEIELRTLERERKPPDLRLACQTRALEGEVVVSAPYW